MENIQICRNFDSLCRLCLVSGVELINIFGESNFGQRYGDEPMSTKIFACTSLEVTQNDELPNCICKTCSMKIVRAFEFRQLANRSNEILRRFVQDKANKRKQEQLQTLFSNKNGNSRQMTAEQLEVEPLAYCVKVEHEDEDENGLKSECDNDESNGEQNLIADVDPSASMMEDEDSEEDPAGIPSDEMMEHEFEPAWMNNGNEDSQSEGTEQKNPWNCQYCNTTFPNEERFKRHSLIHTSEPPFPCDYCDESFDLRTDLKAHWRVHSDGNPHICQMCGKSFPDRMSYLQHSDLHDQVKPYRCPVCKKSFCYGSDLRKHAITHTAVDKEESRTPSKSQENTNETTLDLLPNKSKDKYLATYLKFQEWRQENKAEINENVVLTYFKELSSKLKPPTLWSNYSILRSTILSRNKIDIYSYPQLSAFLKRNSDGYQVKKSKVLTESEVKTFLISAPDEEYLAIKVVLIFGIMGALRVEELVNIQVDQITDYGDLYLVKIPKTEMKKPKSFTIDGQFYNIVKKYRSLRPQKSLTNRFFLNYQKKKCTIQPIGRNKLAGMPKLIAQYLDLPNSELYTGVRPYVCSVCGNSFTRSTSLNKHLRMHNGNRPFKCPACPKIFGSRGDLKRHQIIHSGIKPWICTVCSVPFNRKDKLVRHEKLHSGEPRPFQCYECPTSFSRKEDLTKHIQFHHYKPPADMDNAPSNGSNADTIENSTLDQISKSDLERGNRTFRALIKEAFSGNQVSGWNQSTTAATPVSATVTVSAPTSATVAATPAELKEETPFKCDICHKRFTQKASLDAHQKIHTAIKPFGCSMCEKSFYRRRELSRHEAVHTGYKPYSCGVCGKCFSRTDKLNRHVQTHQYKSIYRNYDCSACMLNFRSELELEKHKPLCRVLPLETMLAHQGGPSGLELDNGSSVPNGNHDDDDSLEPNGFYPEVMVKEEPIEDEGPDVVYEDEEEEMDPQETLSKLNKNPEILLFAINPIN